VICTNHVQRNFLKGNYLYFQYIYQKLHCCPALLPVCSLKENHIYGIYKIVILVYLHNESADFNICNLKYDSGFKPKKNDSWKLMYCSSIIVIMYFEILYSLNLIIDFCHIVNFLIVLLQCKNLDLSTRLNMYIPTT
jgi:hypothetical protein